jgi:hypothetical protein
MDPRERILGIGKLHVLRGEPIPLDVLAEADRLGLSLTDFDQPKTSQIDHEGDSKHGCNEEDIHDL